MKTRRPGFGMVSESDVEPTDAELVCRVALACTDGVGPALFEEIRNAYGTCREAIRNARRRPLLSLPRIGAKTADAVLRLREELPRWRTMLVELGKTGIGVVSDGDANYPQALKALEHPPPLLFVRGELNEEDQWGLAMVGATHPTEEGRHAAIESARRVARRGRTVISGFARGVDSAAHFGAISAGGRTVAFPATGLGKVPPTREFREPETISDSGALLSPFPPFQEWKVGAAMRRNSLVAAMARAVFVVESVRDGGAVYTARVARSLGKPVFALGRKRTGKKSEGNLQLLESGASEIACFADVDRMIENACGDGRANIRQG